VKPRDLNEAVDQLVHRHRVLLFKDERGANIRGDVPSIIEQLEAAVARDGNGNGSGRTGSRPPIAVGVAALLIEIADTAAAAVKERHGNHLHNIPDNLRRIAADHAGLPTGDDTLYWIDTMNSWATRARAALGLDPKVPRGLRGVPCPNCRADSAPTTDDDGKAARMPAIQFEWSSPADTPPDELPDDPKVRAAVCVMCGTRWWAGAAFHELKAQIDKMKADNLSKETLAL
jgi:hypothetical protein